MPVKKYNHQEIESKWTQKWQSDGLYKPDEDLTKPKKYVLDAFAYPSGVSMHAGHSLGYTAADILARHYRLLGYRTINPIGYDSFGLPAEGYAIKTGIHPSVNTEKTISFYQEQITRLGVGSDLTENMATHRPEYYKWTQWFFGFLYSRGLAYKKEALVNWDPVDQTVLANEQVLPDGTAERSGAMVEQKMMNQWFFKITDFVEDRVVADGPNKGKLMKGLLNGLDGLSWPESTKQQQRNWIGKSTGAEVDFEVESADNSLKNTVSPEKPNFVILHGANGKVDGDFLPWIKSELESMGYQVQLPKYSAFIENLDYDAAVENLMKSLKIDRNTIIIGRSLGGFIGLKIIQKLDHKVLGIVTAGSQEVDQKEESISLDYNQIQKNTLFRKSLASVTDSRVPNSHTKDLAEKINAEYIEVNSDDHFRGEREVSVIDSVKDILDRLSLNNPLSRGVSDRQLELYNKANKPLSRGRLEESGVNNKKLTVFTTRIDTILGVSYIVLAPEHDLVQTLITDEYRSEAEKYIEQAKHKTQLQRTDLNKDKTGVFTGSYAINPANDERVPIWIADYVISTYGTGAVMGVPGHDERDHTFAKKYNLDISEVVAPLIEYPLESNKETVQRIVMRAIVKHWQEEKYLVITEKKFDDIKTLVGGGVEDGEAFEESIIRELREETGYGDIKNIKIEPFKVYNNFFNKKKDRNQKNIIHCAYIELNSNNQVEISDKEKETVSYEWLEKDKIKELLSGNTDKYFVDRVLFGKIFSDYGVLYNSGQFDGMNSEEAKLAITEWGEKQGWAKSKITYKLRDWLVSRQRYWGSPIPIVYTPDEND